MGNGSLKKADKDQFISAVRQMKKDINNKPPTTVSTKIDQKYRNHLLEQLYKAELPQNYKKPLAHIIAKTITKESLTQTISLLTALKSNQISNSILKSSAKEKEGEQVSDNVVVRIDAKVFRKKAKNSENMMSHFSSGHFEETEQGRVKFISSMICREINRTYHPLRTICDSFSEMIVEDQCVVQSCQGEEEYETAERYLRKIIIAFCVFLMHGCIGLYRKWILEYTGIEDKKYEKWMLSIIVNEIWSISDGNLARSIFQIIHQLKIPLKIDFAQLIKSANNIIPQDFGIDEQLRIEGNYFSAIYKVCELPNCSRPKDLLLQLEAIKNSICVDIDIYHELAKKGKFYEINGDNIMGIVAYILCKVSGKINQVWDSLLFLKLVYGDIIYYGMDVASYMYSTLAGAVQFLENNSNILDEKEKQILKETGCDSILLEK